MIEIDHVIILVPNLDRAAEQTLSRFGLASVAGGRHAGHGTANRIVPLGPNYLELMAVVDETEAAESPLGRWVTEHTTAELTPAALCLRTDEIESIAAVIGEEPEAMSRRKPDGTILAWHLAGLSGTLGHDALPFFIEWHCEPADHPGATPIEYRVEAGGIIGVTHGSAGPLSSMLADVDGLTIAEGSGVLQAVIQTAAGPIIVD